MPYHLETIPLWEAMETESPCPLCALHEKCEASEIERSLGGSVMEPDERIRVNEHGICGRHHQMLFEMKNRLGHALLTDSHTKETLKKLEKLDALLPGPSKRGLFGGGKTDLSALTGALEALCSDCVICSEINVHMERYLYTFVHLWKSDGAFRQKWNQSRGLCLPHACQLLPVAQKHLSAAQQREFAQSLLSQLKTQLEQDEKDLEWFTLKFDYRNQQKPWGNSRNALERTINRLRGRCIGGEKES